MNNIYRATYTKWLKTHSSNHVEYQRRKRYNWSILSKINFDSQNVEMTQTILTTNNTFFTTVNITSHEANNELERHVFIFNYNDTVTGFNEFKVIFSFDGILITIFQLNDPTNKIKKGLLCGKEYEFDREITLNEKKDVLVDIVEDLIKIKKGLIYDKYQKFLHKEISKSEQEYLEKFGISKLKQNNIIDLSMGNTHWIVVNVKFEKAVSLGLKLKSQCKRVTSLYLNSMPSSKIPFSSNMEVMSVFEYFQYQSDSDLYKCFYRLQKL